MILKLGMKHEEMALYKVYIKHDPWMNDLFYGIFGKIENTREQYDQQITA